MFSGKTIFIAALDWGLGHATRCVPVIRRLQKNNKVIIGITPLTQPVFEEEFPDLQKINIPPYNVTYSRVLPLWIKLLLSWPKINTVIKHEKKLLEETIKKLDVDIVISDNRFGFYSKKIKSIFITHQLFLKTPFAAGIAQKINRRHILNFDEVWVPDYEDETISLSGSLSHGAHYHKNVRYIGPQSRLYKSETQEMKYDVLFLISGPEPQQSSLGSRMLSLVFNNPQLKFAMACNSYMPQSRSNLDFFGSPSQEKLSQLIAQSKKVVCRSGYSTLMDLHLTGKKDLVLIPTPGQTEQEYLADYWKQEFNAQVLRENHLLFFNPEK